MQKTKALRYYLKWGLWILLAQFILVNISAAIYAYKFSHFYDPPIPQIAKGNVVTKTWKLFTGPKFYKNTEEPTPRFNYQDLHLKNSKGTSIHAWFSDARGSETCVILVHGYSVNKSYVAQEAERFRNWGYSVLLFDLRGHGKSEGNGTSFGAKETDELQKAVGFARQQGYSKIILYGVSLGAVICMKAAAEGLVAPDAIIADMPFGTLHRHFQKRANVLGFPSEPFAGLVTFWIGVQKGYNGFRHDVCNYAKKLSCPVLLQWGEKDEFVSREEMEGIFHELSSERKRLVSYPNAGHSSFLDHDPVRWEKEIQAFLKGVR